MTGLQMQGGRRLCAAIGLRDFSLASRLSSLVLLGLYRFKVASAKLGISLAERMTKSSCLSPIIEAIERRLSMNRQLDGWKAV